MIETNVDPTSNGPQTGRISWDNFKVEEGLNSPHGALFLRNNRHSSPALHSQRHARQLVMGTRHLAHQKPGNIGLRPCAGLEHYTIQVPVHQICLLLLHYTAHHWQITRHNQSHRLPTRQETPWQIHCIGKV